MSSDEQNPKRPPGGSDIKLNSTISSQGQRNSAPEQLKDLRPVVDTFQVLCINPKEATGMDVFLMIRHKKTTIFAQAKESSTVLELKHIVEGILKKPPEEQLLYKDHQLLDERKTLCDCGFTSQGAKPQAPVTVGLDVRAGDAFEGLDIHPYSCPPELPDMRKDSGNSAKEQVVQ